MYSYKLKLFIVASQTALPSFSWRAASHNAIPLLRITFPDGDQDDFAVLRRYNPIPVGPNERAEDVDSCIYDGYLRDESDVYVTVTGCASSDNFQVPKNKRKSEVRHISEV
jgi:hypothetical protein